MRYVLCLLLVAMFGIIGCANNSLIDDEHTLSVNLELFSEEVDGLFYYADIYRHQKVTVQFRTDGFGDKMRKIAIGIASIYNYRFITWSDTNFGLIKMVFYRNRE